MIAEFIKWFIVGMFALGALLTVSSVGKQPKTIGPSDAVARVVWNTLYVVLIAVFWQN